MSEYAKLIRGETEDGKICVGTDTGGIIAIMAAPPLENLNSDYADLFAAAPELLEALERFVEQEESGVYYPFNVSEAKAAIKKARGES